MIIWGKIQKRPDTCICTTEPPHSTSETNTINLQINYTSLQNKNQIKVNHYIFSTLPGQGSLSHAPVPQIGGILSFFLICVLPDILNQCLFNEKVKESSLQKNTKHYLCGFFFFLPPSPLFGLITRKTSDKSQLRDSSESLNRISCSCQGQQKANLRNSHRQQGASAKHEGQMNQCGLQLIIILEH